MADSRHSCHMAYLGVGIGVDAGRSIYFEHHRGARTAVMLFHGWGTCCRAWDVVVPTLQASGFAVITYDQRGCGKSDKDFTEVSIDSSAADAGRALEHLQIHTGALNG